MTPPWPVLVALAAAAPAPSAEQAPAPAVLRHSVEIAALRAAADAPADGELVAALDGLLRQLLAGEERLLVLQPRDPQIDAQLTVDQRRMVAPQLVIGGTVARAIDADGAVAVHVTVELTSPLDGAVRAQGRVGGGPRLAATRASVPYFRWRGDRDTGHALLAAAIAARDFVVDRVADMRWTGEVVLHRNGRVYVNRGRRDGVGARQQFVARGVDGAELARLEALRVQEDMTLCKVVSGAPGAVAIGAVLHAVAAP